MQQIRTIYFITFVLAFCSIVYELLLAQSLSAFLGNTVLRYSITIGLYMLAMGIGALLADEKVTRHPVIMLLLIEVVLTVLGGFAVMILHVLDFVSLPSAIFTTFAHLLIIGIGVLTGLEIPLLLKIGRAHAPKSINTILGIDYIGALAGTIIFAFVFYPVLGLVPASFSVGSLNALAGVMLSSQKNQVNVGSKNLFMRLLVVQGLLFLLLVAALFKAGEINGYLIQRYLET